MKTILVTGGAGFIGSHLIKELLDAGHTVVTIDNFTDLNYNKSIKFDRIKIFLEEPEYDWNNTVHNSDKQKLTIYNGDINDKALLQKLFDTYKFDAIVHLAAHSGVRHSLLVPHKYVHDNVMATVGIFEAAVKNKIKHVLYASSSSVYGGNAETPSAVHHNTDDPLSPYAASKKACELFAQSYHNAYGIQLTGMRFFTVYGPWGRPDMALYIFAKGISEGTPIDIYNYGKMYRDFTYVKDITAGIRSLMDTEHGHEVFNLANGKLEELSHFVELIEKYLGKKAKKNLMEIQIGDVPTSLGDLSKINKHVGYTSQTDVDEGVKNFIEWFREYHKI